jgi:5-formyltetrahydrofolate cyclo-ligase
MNMDKQSFLIERKKKLRKEFQSLRSMIPTEERVRNESIIMQFVIESDVFTSSEIVCSYIAFGSEVATKQLHEHILNIGKTLLLPRIMGPKGMIMIAVDSTTKYTSNRYGIQEPIGEAFTFDAAIPSICIMPLLSYDIYGHRLGYGGGFYDIFLENHSFLRRMGIAFSVQSSNIELPSEEHDMYLEFIVNEHGIYEIQKKPA